MLLLLSAGGGGHLLSCTARLSCPVLCSGLEEPAGANSLTTALHPATPARLFNHSHLIHLTYKLNHTTPWLSSASTRNSLISAGTSCPAYLPARSARSRFARMPHNPRSAGWHRPPSHLLPSQHPFPAQATDSLVYSDPPSSCSAGPIGDDLVCPFLREPPRG